MLNVEINDAGNFGALLRRWIDSSNRPEEEKERNQETKAKLNQHIVLTWETWPREQKTVTFCICVEKF